MPKNKKLSPYHKLHPAFHRPTNNELSKKTRIALAVAAAKRSTRARSVKVSLKEPLELKR